MGHRPCQPRRRTYTVDKVEQQRGILGGIAAQIGNPKIGRPSITPPFRPARPAMQRPTGACLKSRSYALPEVVPECRQKRPVDSGAIKRSSQRVKDFTEIRMHAVDGIVAYGAHGPCCGRRILPRKVAGSIDLVRHSPINAAKVFINFRRFSDPFEGVARWRMRATFTLTRLRCGGCHSLISCASRPRRGAFGRDGNEGCRGARSVGAPPGRAACGVLTCPSKRNDQTCDRQALLRSASPSARHSLMVPTRLLKHRID